MAIGEILAAGKVAGETMKKVLDKLPDDEQRILRKYFDFLDTFNEEISRQDGDFDTILAYHERKKALEGSFIGAIKK